jgi:hypothetical protein
MKILLLSISTFVLFSSCSKNTDANQFNDSEPVSKITYDTTAIDSFGPGATSESVMAKINAVAIKREQDSLAKIAKAEQEKLEKEKLEKEKKEKDGLKAEEEKKEFPKPKVEKLIDNSASTNP